MTWTHIDIRLGMEYIIGTVVRVCVPIRCLGFKLTFMGYASNIGKKCIIFIYIYIDIMWAITK